MFKITTSVTVGIAVTVVAATWSLSLNTGVVFAQQAPQATQAQTPTQEGLNPAPPRRADEGKGPFKTLVIRGVMLIDGTGAPPAGPVDVVVSGNRIASIRSAGTPGLPLRANRAPQTSDLEVDATGMYLMPGFVDIHVH